MLHLIRLGAGGLLLFLSAVAGAGPSPLEPAIPPRVAGAAPPDTVQSSVAAGAPLVRSLPPRLNDTPVARYAVLDGPALSGTAGYSFTWITRGTAPGTYTIALEALHPDTPPDTLVVQVDVQSK